MVDIAYCPSCGDRGFNKNCEKSYICSNCNFVYYHNAAAATSAIIEYGDKILMTFRAREPGVGLLDLPGGFIDPGESAEHALAREIKEELNIEVGGLKYCCSFPNEYVYGEILYHTIDVIFIVKLSHLPDLTYDDHEVSGVEWIGWNDIPFDKIAFKSVSNALKFYVDKRAREPEF